MVLTLSLANAPLWVQDSLVKEEEEEEEKKAIVFETERYSHAFWKP